MFDVEISEMMRQRLKNELRWMVSMNLSCPDHRLFLILVILVSYTKKKVLVICVVILRLAYCQKGNIPELRYELWSLLITQ